MKKLLGVLSVTLAILLGVLAIFIQHDNINRNISSSQSTRSTSAISPTAPTLPTIQRSTRPDNSGKTPSSYTPVSGSGEMVDASVQTESTTEQTTENVTQNAVETESASETKTFTDEMYAYRAMLSSTEKTVYDEAYVAASNRRTSFNASAQLTQEQLADVMTALYNDNPDLFYLDTSYSYKYTDKGVVISVTLNYNDTANSYINSSNKFNAVADAIISEASKQGTDLQKETYVYNAIKNMCTYDESSLLNQSAYSAMVNGSSVCAGYSRAFQYIMMELGIPCYFCSGTANNGPHAWNIVKIDGRFYNVDLSWDDSLGELSTTPSTTYFNISDSTISVDHTRRDMSRNLPACN